MDPNNTSQIEPPIRYMNQPHIPISESEMNPNPGHAPKSATGTLLTLASLLVLAGVVGITLWLYIQNKTGNISSNNQKTSVKTQNIKNEPTKEIAGTKVVGEENIKKMEKYGVICKRFTNLESALAQKEVACTLDLSGQNLTEIPEDVYKLEKLNEIDLSNNKLTSIPQKLIDMPNIISINLSKNNISSINGVINKKAQVLKDSDATPVPLERLQSLNLSGNPISSEDQLKLKKLFDNGNPSESESSVVKF